MSLYGEASAAALQSPVLATGLSPLDGVLVPSGKIGLWSKADSYMHFEDFAAMPGE
jgi:hypothetical protein